MIERHNVTTDSIEVGGVPGYRARCSCGWERTTEDANNARAWAWAHLAREAAKPLTALDGVRAAAKSIEEVSGV